jgi:hypothetical protein
MSLNLTIINAFGIWQCADHRLVNTSTMKIEDDESVKQVQLRCTDGSAVISYAGIGKLNGVSISDWVREILRGESRTVDESLIFLRENATRDLGPYLKGRLHHMFTVGAVLGGHPWLAQIRNFTPTAKSLLPAPQGSFETAATKVGTSVVSAFPPLVLDADVKKLIQAAPKRPRKPEEFSELLASINRKVAAGPAQKIVSPHCVTTYVPQKGEPFTTKFHDTSGVSRSLIVPMLLFGIDTTEMMKGMMRIVPGEAPPDIDADASQAVKPQNRLRRGP